MKIYIKFLTAIMLFCTALSQQVKAQGVDVIFLLDNSGSMDATEWNNASASIKKIMNEVIACSEHNRGAVVHYGTDPFTSPILPKIYIASDFTKSITTITNFSRQSTYFWDDASASLSIIGDALDGVSNSDIQSPQKKLTRDPKNRLVIFLFSDATRLGAPSSSLVSTTGSDPFIVYNQFKTDRNATFITLLAPSGSTPTEDSLAKAAAAAIASTGGSFMGDVEANTGDPQGSGAKPRKMVYSSTFSVSQADLDILIDDICTSCSPLVTIDAVTPPSQNVCVGATPTALSVTATGTGTITYQWYSNTTNSTTSGTAITGAISSTYTPPTTTVGTVYYYVVVSDTHCDGEGVSSTVNVTTINDPATCNTCNAGTTAPAVTATLANDCTSATPNTVDLDDAHTGTAPTGTDLVWRTDSNPLLGAAVANPAAVGAGTYYAFYYSSAGAGCYSPASAVTVTINPCATCTNSGVTSVNLNQLYTGTFPTGVILEWWTSPTRDLAPTPGTLVPNPTNVTVSGTYYAFFYDEINDCYNTDNSTASVVVNILPPCVTCTNSGVTTGNLTTLFNPANLPHPSVVVEWWTSPTRDLAPTAGTKVSNPTQVPGGTYYAFFYDSANNCYNTDNSTASVVVNILPPCNNACYEDPALVAGQTYPVKHGISILGRAGKTSSGTTNTASDWPMVRNSAYTALESKTKGFVITRTANPETAIASPVVGMMVFDTDENVGKGCLKIYTGDGTGEGWKCFTTPACP